MWGLAHMCSYTADRRGAAGRCSTAVRGVSGSNPGSGMDVVFVRCWFLCPSVSCYCRLEPAWIVEEGLYYPMSSRAESFVLNWLTVTITKSNKSSNRHLSFVIYWLFMVDVMLVSLCFAFAIYLSVSCVCMFKRTFFEIQLKMLNIYQQLWTFLFKHTSLCQV